MITAWTLIACTQAWGLCGMMIEVRYPTEQQCIRERDELYKRSKPDAYRYVICKPEYSAPPSESGTGQS